MESKIKELVCELLTKYEQVDKQLAGIETPSSEVERVQAMSQINLSMNETKNIEQQLGPMRMQFDASGGKLSEQTIQLFETAKSVVAGLIVRIKNLENEAFLKRESLTPQIRSGARANQMQKAYFANLKAD